MIWDNEKHRYVLSSGRTSTSNGGILGLGPLDNDLCGGYDGVIFGEACEWDEDFVPLTPFEKAEIALYMQDAWEVWART